MNPRHWHVLRGFVACCCTDDKHALKDLRDAEAMLNQLERVRDRLNVTIKRLENRLEAYEGGKTYTRLDVEGGVA